MRNSVPRCAFHSYDHCDALGKKAPHLLPSKKYLATEKYSGYQRSICVKRISFLFVPSTLLSCFCIVFPLFGNKEPPLAKSVESSFQNESTPPITFVPDPVNKVMETAIENESRPAIITSLADSGSLLKKKNRLNQFGFQPLDVGGAGGCYFRAVSHQLYGDVNSHVYIRMSGLEYMKDYSDLLLLIY